MRATLRATRAMALLVLFLTGGNVHAQGAEAKSLLLFSDVERGGAWTGPLLVPSSRSSAQAPSATAPFPRGEVYAGIAYSNLSLLGFATRRHGVGWGAGVTGYFTRNFGITGDFGGQYDPECPQNDIECFVELLRANEIHDYSAHQFLVGPRVRVPARQFDVFFQALFGGVRTHASILNTSSGIRTEIASGPHFAMAYGGGLDWNVGERFAIRLFQVDYIPVREDPGVWRHNVRIQGGVVFRFGG